MQVDTAPEGSPGGLPAGRSPSPSSGYPSQQVRLPNHLRWVSCPPRMLVRA
jgi:hypothetical protein